MSVKIKDFGIPLDVKTKGVEFAVSYGKGHVGDLYVTQTGLVWCEGRTTRAKGRRITWEEFRGLCSGKSK